MMTAPDGLSFFTVQVSRNAHDAKRVVVAARDVPHARVLARESVRARCNLPTSVQLFAEVIR